MKTKFLLKKAMEGIIPSDILKRPKKGFNMPVAYWLNSDLKELVRDQFQEAKIRREGFFNPTYIQKLMTEHSEGTRDNRKLLWTLLVFELWHEKYITKSGSSP